MKSFKQILKEITVTELVTCLTIGYMFGLIWLS